MGEFLPHTGGGEADVYAGLVIFVGSQVPRGEFAEAIGDAVQGVGLGPVACDEEDFTFCALERREKGFEDAVACSEGYALDVGGCKEAGGVGRPVIWVIQVLCCQC